MFRKLILSLRQKPKSVRNRVALISASVFTAILFAAWIYHAPVRQAALESKSLNDIANESPGFSELFGAIGKTVSSFKEEIDSTSTTSDPSAEDVLLLEGMRASLSTESVSTTSEEEKLPAQSESFYSHYDEESVAREIKIVSVPPASTSEDIKNSEPAPVDQL